MHKQQWRECRIDSGVDINIVRLLAILAKKLAHGWILILNFENLGACPDEKSPQNDQNKQEKKQ